MDRWAGIEAELRSAQTGRETGDNQRKLREDENGGDGQVSDGRFVVTKITGVTVMIPTQGQRASSDGN